MNKAELKAEIISQLSKFGNNDQDQIDYTFEFYSLIDDIIGIKDLIIGINVSRDPNVIQSNITLIRYHKDPESFDISTIFEKLNQGDLDDGLMEIKRLSDEVIAIDLIY